MTTSKQNQSSLPGGNVDPGNAAWEAWHTEDTPETRKALLEAVSPQIGTALHTFAPGMEQGLLLKANTMAMNAAKSYDPNRGLKFKNYVYQQLQPLQRVAGKRSNIVQVPERHLIEGRRLAEETQRFLDERGYEPSTADLADFTGMSIKRIETIRSHRTSVSESKATSPEGDPMSAQREDLQKAWCDYVYSSLPSFDQKIYEWRTGYAGSPTLGVVEISRRLGTSPATVSQRMKRITEMIQEGMNLE